MTGTNPEKLYDLTMVEAMCRGNKDKILKMVVTFTRTITEAVDELLQAYTIMDITAIKKIAHRIKPTLAIYSVSAIGDEVLVLEHYEGNGDNNSHLGSMIVKIEQVVTSVVNELKKEYLIN